MARIEYYQEWEIRQYEENNPRRYEEYYIHSTRIGDGIIDAYWGHMYGGDMCRYEGCRRTFNRREDRCLHEIYEHGDDEQLKGYFKHLQEREDND